MKYLKQHPINDKAQKLSKLKKEDVRKAKEKKMSAEKDLAKKPKTGRVTTDPSNKKLDGEKFLAESMSQEKIEELKNKIDQMSHRELASLWRHGSSDNELFHGEVGQYLKDRLFNHFGGFNPNLSKSIGW